MGWQAWKPEGWDAWKLKGKYSFPVKFASLHIFDIFNRAGWIN
jgi:hypothetical protein